MIWLDWEVNQQFPLHSSIRGSRVVAACFSARVPNLLQGSAAQWLLAGLPSQATVHLLQLLIWNKPRSGCTQCRWCNRANCSANCHTVDTQLLWTQRKICRKSMKALNTNHLLSKPGFIQCCQHQWPAETKEVQERSEVIIRPSAVSQLQDKH